VRYGGPFEEIRDELFAAQNWEQRREILCFLRESAKKKDSRVIGLLRSPPPPPPPPLPPSPPTPPCSQAHPRPRARLHRRVAKRDPNTNVRALAGEILVHQSLNTARPAPPPPPPRAARAQGGAERGRGESRSQSRSGCWATTAPTRASTPLARSNRSQPQPPRPHARPRAARRAQRAAAGQAAEADDDGVLVAFSFCLLDQSSSVRARAVQAITGTARRRAEMVEAPPVPAVVMERLLLRLEDSDGKVPPPPALLFGARGADASVWSWPKDAFPSGESTEVQSNR
jgi:hypothetical protein